MRYYSLQCKYQNFSFSYLSFLFAFNRPWDTSIKYFLGLFIQTPPLINPSFLHSIDHEILLTIVQIPKNFPRASPPDPLIYPSCLHSKGQEIQISNTLWSFAPRPPHLSILFIFNKPWDYYTLKHIFQKFSWGLPYLSFLFTFNRPGDTNIKQFVGLCTQFPSFFLPFYIQ